jgi:histidyl-tRNA synthetase
MITSAAEGMRDLMPEDVLLRNYVISKILDVYRRYGFSQIETPCADRIELFTAGDGGENEKMLFKILKRGEKLNQALGELADLGLRYDLTVPLSRFYAAHRSKLPNPFKVIQIGSVWRAERPQKGRFRQFTQCDIDIIGQNSILAEIELIEATSEALLSINFVDFEIKINDRRLLEALAEYADFQNKSEFFIIFDKLDKIGLQSVVEELLKAGFAADSCEKFKKIAQKGEHIKTVEQFKAEIPELMVSQEVLSDLDKILKTSKSRKYNTNLDLSLVRGMGYYTSTIFEIKAPNYGSSIAGGGRYDKMIGKRLQNKEEIPACGFSIGFERVVQILAESGFKVPVEQEKIALIYPKDTTDFEPLMEAAAELRSQNAVVSLEVEKKNKAAQLQQLAQMGFTGVCSFEPQTKNLSKIKELKVS